MPKKAYLTLRLSADDKASVVEAARVLSVSVSDVIRRYGVEGGVAIGQRSVEAASVSADAA